MHLRFAADKDVTLQSVALEVRRVPSCKSVVILLYDTAMGLAEILNLRVSDLFLNSVNPYVRVTGKGGKERVVAVNYRTVEHVQHYLDAYRSRRNPNTDLLFYTTIRGASGRMSDGNVERFLQQYADKARDSCPQIPPRVPPPYATANEGH